MELVTTDGFLLPNAVLNEKGILAAFFAVLIIVVILDATRISIKAIRSRELLPNTEVPAEESQLRAPSGLFTRDEEFEWAGR